MIDKIFSKLEQKIHKMQAEKAHKSHDDTFQRLYENSYSKRTRKASDARCFSNTSTSNFNSPIAFRKTSIDSSNKRMLLNKDLSHQGSPSNKPKLALKFPKMKKKPQNKVFIFPQKEEGKDDLKFKSFFNQKNDKNEKLKRYLRKDLAKTRNSGSNLPGILSNKPYNDFIQYQNEITRIMGTKGKQDIAKPMGKTERSYLNFNEAFQSLKMLTKCNLDSFIDSHSYFSKSRDEVSSLYYAIREPDRFENIFEAFGLSEKRFKTGSDLPAIKQKDKLEVLKRIYRLIGNIDNSVDLPKIDEKFDINEVMHLKDSDIKVMSKTHTGFSKLYEDPK